MVSLIKIGNRFNSSTLSIIGLSTDPKPIDEIDGLRIQNGSEYTEIDTGKQYVFNGSTKTWVEKSTVTSLPSSYDKDIAEIRGNIDLIKDSIGISSVKTQNFTGLSHLHIEDLNDANINVSVSSDNLVLLPYDNNFSNTLPSTDKEVSSNGLTFRPNSDGSISIWGTASANTTYNLRNYYGGAANLSRFLIEPNTYTIGIATKNLQNLNTGCIRVVTNLYSATPIHEGAPATFTLSESKTGTLQIMVTKDFVGVKEEDPVTIYPIINIGTVLKEFTCPYSKGYDPSEVSIFPQVSLSVQTESYNTEIIIDNNPVEVSLNNSTSVTLSTNLPMIVSVFNASVLQEDSSVLDKKFATISSSSVGISPTSKSIQKLSDGDELEIEETMAKKNKQLVFFGRVNTMGTLKIFHGENIYNSGWMELDNTNISVYTYDTEPRLRKSVEHGLTINNYIGIIATTGNHNNLSIRIITNGGLFDVDNIYWSASNGMIKVVSDGCDMENITVSWNCDDFKKPIWMFGDSYFDFQNTARWPYYMIQWGFDNCAAFGFPGAKSSDVYPEWIRCLSHGRPKYAVWCLGMNDIDNISSINSDWEKYINQFINDCNQAYIEPILATIPNTPNRRHTYKNEFVKTSGYRYIDFAKAVGANDYPSNWDNGMISDDNTHPLEEGAKALAIRALTDIPELLQT